MELHTVPEDNYLDSTYESTESIKDGDKDQVEREANNNSTLKTSLFNQNDKIDPIKRYYYDHHGEMALAGRQRRPNGVRDHIERAEKHLVLAQLTKEYGGKAVKIMNILNSGLHDQKRVIEAYEGFRLNNTEPESHAGSALGGSPKNDTLVIPTIDLSKLGA